MTHDDIVYQNSFLLLSINIRPYTVQSFVHITLIKIKIFAKMLNLINKNIKSV